MNTKDFEKDWRNTGQMKYLFKKKFGYSNYSDAVVITDRDHEHCEFCWDTISTHPDAILYGYHTDDLSRWVCPRCFEELKMLFEWEIVGEEDNE